MTSATRRAREYSCVQVIEKILLSYICYYFSMIIITLTIIQQQNVIMSFVYNKVTSQLSDALIFFPNTQWIINQFQDLFSRKFFLNPSFHIPGILHIRKRSFYSLATLIHVNQTQNRCVFNRQFLAAGILFSGDTCPFSCASYSWYWK